MRYLGDGREVVPFWNRIPAFFQYPLHRAPLLVMSLCTLIPALLTPGWLSGVIILILVLALFKYTYSVINHTAEGRLEPPGLGEAFSGSGFDVAVQQLLVFAILVSLVLAAAHLGGGLLAFLALAFVVLTLPASILVLAMDRQILSAVNPFSLTGIVARIGWPYFVLYGHVILLMLASGFVQDLALQHFPAWLSQPVAGLITSYFMLVLFHMLGYLLLQYRDELGLDALVVADDAHANRDRSRRREADIDMAIKDGAWEKVMQLLQEALKARPDDPQRLEQLYRLVMALQDPEPLLKNLKRLLPWLCLRRPDALPATLERVFSLQPDWLPETPEQTVQCAQALFARGEARLVLKIMKDFHVRFPDYPELASAYLLVARVLANDLQQWDKAAAFLRFIQQRCAGHPLHAHVHHYMARVNARQPLDALPLAEAR